MVWRAGSMRLPELLASVLRSRRPLTYAQGMSLIELLIGCGVLSVLLGMALPIVLTTRDDMSVRGAARHLAGQAMLVRAQAVRRGTAVGLRFESTTDGYRYGSYVDGDGDGIRTTDILEGVDTELHPAERLRDRFPSVSFALDPGLPPVDGRRAVGDRFDPIRLGRSDILTYTPLGTSTSGSVYLKGRTGQQYAVRILGTTGRLRVLRFDAEAGAWSER